MFALLHQLVLQHQAVAQIASCLEALTESQ